MSHQLVVTAVGPDRPGLVGEFTGIVHKAGANLSDSRMINLRGQFALVALLEGQPEVLENVRSALRAAGSSLRMTFEFAQAEPSPSVPGVSFRIKTYSMDQPGIVHQWTTFLREQGINIEELDTHLEPAAFSGTPVFTMQARITVPTSLAVSQLRRSLEAFGEKVNCDVDLAAG